MTGPAPRIVTRDFVLLTIAHLLQALGFSSMVLLPVFLDHLGAQRTEIGLLMGLGSASSLALRPAVAWALDTFGRHPTLFAGTVVLSTGMICFAAVDQIGIGVYGARLLTGIGTGTLFAGYFAFASDLVPIERRTQGIALFGISGLVPLVVNPLAQRAGVAPGDIGVFFAGLGALILLSLVPLMWIPRRPRPPLRRQVTLGAVVRAMQAPEVRPVWLATTGLAALVAAFFAFSTVTAEHRHVANPALLWLTYAGGAAVVRLLFAFLPHNVPPRRLVPPAFLLYAAAAALVAASTSDAGFALAGLCAGLGHGMGFPVLVSQVASRMPDHLRGSGMAGYTGLWETIALGVTPILGAIADSAGDGPMFLLLSAAAVGCLVLWVPLERRYGPPGEVA